MNTPKGDNKTAGSGGNDQTGRDSGGRPGNGRPRKDPPKQRGAKKDADSTTSGSYVGHTAELSDCLITDQGNKSSQFKELLERLSTYASSKYSANVGDTIEEMREIPLKNFMPTPLDKKQWLSPRIGENGNPEKDNEGNIIYEVDEDTKKVLEAMHNEMVKKKTDHYVKYGEDLRAMFKVTLGQVDHSIKSKLKSMPQWEATKAKLDTVSLLMMLRTLCYQDSRTRVDRMTNIIRVQRKLITSRQRGDDCAAYVREVEERYKVFKALGGSILFPEVLEASLEGATITLQQYYALPVAEQAPYNKIAEDRYLAALIVEGCNEETSILKTRLAQQFILGTSSYPKDPTRAQEMLIEFAGTKTKNVKKGDSKKGDRHRKGDQSTGTTLVTASESSRDLEGAQVLMNAIASGESFNPNDGVLFLQVGEITTEFDDNESIVSAASTGGDDWDYWLAKDASDGDVAATTSNNVAGITDTPPVPSSSVTITAPDAICVTPRQGDNSDISPLSTETVMELPYRSEEQPTHGAHGVMTHKDGAETTTTPHTETIENQTNGEITTETMAPKSNNPKQKPDPPGRTIGENPRSERNARLSGAPSKNCRSVARRTGQHNPSNLIALDLAMDEWQKKTIVGGMNFSYSRKVEAMFAQHRGGIDPNWLLLDSESSVNLITNRQLLENIRVAPNGCNLTVHCNAGAAKTNLIGELKGFGTVWFYEEGIANVISLGLVTNKFRVTMDSDIDNAMYVHKPDGTIRRFPRGGNNLYYYDLRDAGSSETLLTITTVEGQKEKFSGIDRKRAERAYKLQEIFMYPSDKDFLRMIDNKAIQNCPITRRDVKIARQIYGKNRGIIQGKSVRRQVPHVREDITLVPEEVLENYKHVTLSVDILYVNGVRFVVSISRHINYRTARAITNMQKSTLLSSVRAIMGEYSARGFVVKLISADNQFECIRDELLELDEGVTLNTTAAGEHEPYIERSNRTVKERIRCAFTSTPFKRMTIRMVTELTYSAMFWLNSVVPENGVSTTLSPRELMKGIALDASKHARFQFGEYLLSHEDETNNGMDPRALDTVYLRPCGNVQGGFYALDLETGKRVHRMHADPLPMTNAVIRRVQELSAAEKSPEGLIFGDSQNNNTVLDFVEEANEDDDDASDRSYKPSDDDDSVETELSDVTETSEVNDNIDDRPIPEAVEAVDNHVAEGDVDSGEEQEPEPVAHEEGDTTEVNHISDHEEDEGLPTENEQDDSESTDTNSTTDEGSETPEEGKVDQQSNRMSLRPTVRISHNKFTESEGYQESVVHRASAFTAGYANGLNKILSDEIGYMHAASAIAQYNNIDASQVSPQYGVRQGIKEFGEAGVDAVLAELKQIHDRMVMVPMDPKLMTKEMRDKALPYLMFLKRKRCGKIKGRGCADGRRQREFISKEEAYSPTVSLYALMISCLIDAIEGRDVATADIPGAFLQTDMPDDEEVYIRLDGTMAELLCRLNPKLYTPCMMEVGASKRKVLYARAKKAIYGTLRAALLFYENLTGTLTEWGYKMNPYDSCTMNKMINGHQATICWHVDDLKISHKDPAVVTNILKDLNDVYGKITPLTSTRGKVHDYVGMTIDFSEGGKVKFSMFDYLEDIFQNMPAEFKGEAQTPASNHLFTVDEDGEKLSEDKAIMFHHYVAKLLFMSKRTRPDIAVAIAFLCTRVKSPDVHDWKKLIRVMKYLQLTPFLPLVLGWDKTGEISWYVDASFAVHKDMRSHTGGVMTLGNGAVISMSSKQKINTKSSTEAELVGVDDILNIEVWSRHYLDEQFAHSGSALFKDKSRLLQDNTSAMRLEKNGKASSTKRTRHIDIRYFFITGRLDSGKLDVEYCSTEDMLADFMTKPLQGSPFRKHRNQIMGISNDDYLQYKDEYYKAKGKHINNKIVRPGDGGRN